VPLLNALHAWMIKTAALIDKKCELAAAFNYTFNHWEALQRYTQDGRLEIDNSIAERSVRGIGVGRNYRRLRIIEDSTAMRKTRIGIRRRGGAVIVGVEWQSPHVRRGASVVVRDMHNYKLWRNCSTRSFGW
jgi:hypothetical protein